MSESEQLWEPTTIGDIIALDYGRALADSVRSGDGYPVYGSSGLVGRNSKALVDGPGIIVGRKGTVGAVTWSSEHFWPIDTTYYVRWLDEKATDRRWTYWFLLTLPLKRLDSSTGVPGLNRNDAYRLRAQLPPITEQRRIAEILDTADEAIRSTERVIAKLERANRGLLHDLLTRGIDESGRLRDPQHHPEQFALTQIGWRPRGWQISTIHEIVINCDSRRIPLKQEDRARRRGSFPYYGASGIIDYIDDYLFDGSYILLGEDGENVVSRNLPLAFIASGRFWVNNHAHVFEPLPRNNIDFLTALFESMDFGHLVNVSAQPKLTQSALDSLVFAVPSFEEQNRISDRIATSSRQLDTYRDELAKLRLLKQGLVEDLLTGRVRAEAAA